MSLLRLLIKHLFGPSSGSGRKDPSTRFQEGSHVVRAGAHANINADTVLVGNCYVVDGDTIFIGDVSIRLAGIDAPELDHPWGRNAKRALMDLCRGKTVRAVCDGNVSHNRCVATCFLPDGRDLSAEMVKLGFAIDWPKYSHGKYRQFEHEGIRRKFWRADARQKGRFPPRQISD